MMSLEQVSKVLSAEMHGNDVNVKSVSTDTRSLQSGDLYIALQGDHFDGHDYIDKAISAGAAAVVMHKKIEVSLPALIVKDTRKALGELGAAWRQKFVGKLIAVTGSNGKTTVKEMLALILQMQGNVLATKGNFNNDIGLPLTLLRLQQEDYAVIEMGANHHGEIAYLTDLTKPDVAVITNAGPAHLDGFGSIKGVAEAKGEIYEGLEKNGIAVINRDDDYAEYWRSNCGTENIIDFSIKDKKANVFAECLIEGVLSRVKIHINYLSRVESFEVLLQVPGLHNIKNALAAVAAAIAVGINAEKIQSALNQFKSVKGRLNIHKLGQVVVIDDTYNANPASLQAGIDVLNELPGEHWLVLGDMGELGDEERRLHFDAGLKARREGVNTLLALGKASQFAVEAFGSGAMHFESSEELLGFVKQHQPDELGILVKGSRFMQMEKIVESLIKGYD